MFAGSGLFLSVLHFLVNEISSSDFKTELDASIFLFYFHASEPSYSLYQLNITVHALNDLNLLICI